MRDPALTPAPDPGRRRLGIVLRALISLALLALVARRLDWAEAARAAARVRPATLALATGLALIGYWGRALRWTYLLRRAGVALPGFESYRLTLVGIFYGLVTPGRVGEIGRVLHLGLPAARTLPSAIWDRLADVLLLELLSLPALVALAGGPGGAGAYRALLAAYVAVVAATALIMVALDSRRALAPLARALPRFAAPIEAWRRHATGTLRSAAFARGLAAGLFFYALNFAGAQLLLAELAPGHPATLTLLFPLIILLGNLPVAFGGLGLREQVSALAFGRLGAAAAAGPVFSLLWFLVVTVVPALIGLALPRRGRAVATALDAGSRAAGAGGAHAG